MNIEKLKAILNCMKDSETILGGEYYVIHSDYIIALEENINNVNNTDIIVKVENIEEIKQEIERLNNIIKEVREYANNIKFETKREEKIQDDILEILDKGSE